MRKRPSYIPARNFAVAVLGQVADARFSGPLAGAGIPAAASPSERMRFAAERIDNGQLRRLVLSAIDAGGDDLDAVRRHLEATYDSAMDRVSGWYKRHTQVILFVLGLIAALALNVNTITLTHTLIKDADVRQALVERAERYQEPALPPAARPAALPPSAAAQQPSGAVTVLSPAEELKATGLALGWSDHARTELWRSYHDGKQDGLSRGMAYAEVIGGFLITAFAVMLGAPFWFDVLNRLMVIRATVKPHEKSREERSQDPSDPVPPAPAPAGAAGGVTQPVPKPRATPEARAVDTEVYATELASLETELSPASRPRQEDVAPALTGGY